MANIADLIKSGAQQQAAGKALDSETIGTDAPEGNSQATVDSEEVFRAENSTTEESLTEDTKDISAKNEDTPQDSPDLKKPETSEKEVIVVSDEKGRRKVEIDWNNREQLKKYVQMSFGARKWQAERDQAIQSRKELESKTSEREGDWSRLEGAFQQGDEAFYDRLRGKGAFQAMVKKHVERAKFLDNASPEEVESYNRQERLERLERELAAERADKETFKKKIIDERDTAETRSMEARIHPVFNKYRFADKLGDADDEHMFDEMLWNTSMKRLEAYEEQGLDISPELTEREFATVARSIRKRIGLLAEKKASRDIEQKKQEATENVQSKVMSGYKTGGARAEAQKLLDSGNTLGLLKNWGKYGSMFGGKR